VGSRNAIGRRRSIAEGAVSDIGCSDWPNDRRRRNRKQIDAGGEQRTRSGFGNDWTQKLPLSTLDMSQGNREMNEVQRPTREMRADGAAPTSACQP